VSAAPTRGGSVAGQKLTVGRQHKYQTLTVHVSDTTLAIELPDGETRTVRRTTDGAVRSIKGQDRGSLEPQFS
jgi:hypothetical protein